MDQRAREGVHAKLDRASEHLKALERDTATFLDEKPHTYWAKPDFHAGTYSIHITIHSEPPLSLSVICGDYIHCLRSALDHLVCGAVPKISKRTSFPLYKDADDYFCGVVMPAKRKQRGPLTGLDPQSELFALIQSVQPYAGPHGYALHPLFYLSEFSNADKHRAILATTAAHRRIEGQTLDVIAHDVKPSDAEYALGVPLKNGAKIAWGTLKVTGLNPHMEVGGSFPAEIAFGDAFVRFEGLNQMAESVRGIVAEALRIIDAASS